MSEYSEEYARYSEQIGRHFYRIPRSWRTLLDKRLAPLGLTQTRWMTLYCLARAGEGLMQRELASFIGVEAPSLVRTLDQLAEQGLIERRSCEGDRRSKLVYLTPAANPLLEKIKKIATNARRELLEGISIEDAEKFLELLEKVEKNSQRLLEE